MEAGGRVLGIGVVGNDVFGVLVFTIDSGNHNWVVTSTRNRPDKEILVPDWFITSHVSYITSSDWLFTWSGWFL